MLLPSPRFQFTDSSFQGPSSSSSRVPQRTNEDCDCSSGSWSHPLRSTGGHPVGVPGVLAVVDRINKEYGSLPLKEIVKPAVRLAKQGFPVYKFLHDQLKANEYR